MMRFGQRHLSSILTTSLIAIGLVACGDDDKDKGDNDTTADTTPGEVDATQADSTQVETADDTAAPDTTEADTTEADTSEPDTSEPDTADGDTAEPDTSDCEYFQDVVILKCGQAFAQISRWTDFLDNACADYFTRGEDRYETIEALAAGEGCEASCVYVASQAVDFIRCDGQGRSGFETFRAEGEGCLDGVYRTEDGIFSDLCFWATYQCWCEPE